MTKFESSMAELLSPQTGKIGKHELLESRELLALSTQQFL